MPKWIEDGRSLLNVELPVLKKLMKKLHRYKQKVKNKEGCFEHRNGRRLWNV